MEIPENNNCDFLGWALIDLDNAAPRPAREVAERMGISIEEFMDIALREKLERMEPHLAVATERGNITAIQESGRAS
jgi:hypothetical protein